MGKKKGLAVGIALAAGAGAAVAAKNYKKAEYAILLMEAKLNQYLHDIDVECEEKIKTIISQLVKQENVTEELKVTNQMEWVGKMNSIKNRAEEIVLNELVYV